MIPIHDDNPTARPSVVTWVLLGLCVSIFVFQYTGSPQITQQIIFSFGLIPAVLNNYATLPAEVTWISPELTVITSMFLHGGFMHLAGNMLYLWIFGNNVEDCMGRFRFIVFYLVCGAAAAYAQIFVNPESTIPMVGASGAISGVLGAYLLVYPKANVLVIIPLGFIIQTIRLPAVIVLLVWFAIQIFSSLNAEPGTPGVAWYAHVGGFVAGVILIPLFKSPRVPFFGGKSEVE
ncbi:MAG: rhomboid family intramembrane serine protease [Pseudomonadota bacterium]